MPATNSRSAALPVTATWKPLAVEPLRQARPGRRGPELGGPAGAGMEHHQGPISLSRYQGRNIHRRIQAQAEAGRGRGGPQIMGQVQVAPDRVGLRVKRRHPLGEGQVTQLPGLIIAHLAGTLGQGHPHGALEQALDIHHQVEGAGPELLHQPAQPGRIGPGEKLGRAQAGGNPDFVQGRVAGQQRRIRGLHQPGDVGAGIGVPQGLQGGQPMEHIPEGTELDE